jgi:membrane protease YdiL (CAAX protease family)
MGPDTIRMPRWPGLVLIIGGGFLAAGALGTAELIARGDLEGDAGPIALLALLGALLFGVGLLYVAIRQLRVRRVLPPERYRGPSVFILLALALVVAAVLTAPFGADVLALDAGEGELSLLGSIFILVAVQVGLVLIGYLFIYRPNALAALPSFPGPRPARALLSGLGWGVLAWIGSTLVVAVVVAVLTSLGQAPEPDPAERAIALLDPIVVVLAVVVLAPIAEELFFRGIVFNAWLREGGRRWAYIGSAALFAAVHLSLVSALPIFLLGLALAWVYERTRNLLAPIAMHATVNGISVTIALLERFDVIRLPAA